MERPLCIILHKFFVYFGQKYRKSQNFSFCLKVSERCTMIDKIDKVFVGLMGDFQEDERDE